MMKLLIPKQQWKKPKTKVADYILWMEQNGKNLENLRRIREECERKGHQVSLSSLDEFETLELDVEQMYYVDDFYKLSSSRVIRESSIGPIPFSEIYSFLKLDLSLIDVDVDTYVEIILAIDNKYRDYHNTKIKQELDRLKNKSRKH
jgi:hypothetical protein